MMFKLRKRERCSQARHFLHNHDGRDVYRTSRVSGTNYGHACQQVCIFTANVQASVTLLHRLQMAHHLYVLSLASRGATLPDVHDISMNKTHART